MISLARHSKSSRSGPPRRSGAKAGFTLIELSIVLVIIGLLVGGILVGQDLIHASSLRAQISQYEHLKSEILTFQIKFNGMPGDIPNPSKFGFYEPPGAGAAGMGDGDGLITSPGYLGVQGPCNPSFSGEVSLLWRHLAMANLISGESSQDDALYGDNSSTSAMIGVAFPATKLWSDMGSIIVAMPDNCGGGVGNILATGGLKNYIFSGMRISQAPEKYLNFIASNNWIPSSAFTPVEAYAIDEKMDDGNPMAGGVQSRFAYNTAINIIPDAINLYSLGCINSNDPSIAQYVVSGANATSRACWLRVDLGM